MAAFDVTMKIYKDAFPDVPIYFGDEPRAEHFNLSAARNIACEAAIADGCTVLVVSDADAIPETEAVELAMRMVGSGSEDFVLPFTTLKYLSEKASVDVLNGKDFDKEDVEKSGGWVGGIMVISERCFKALNGWDERFMSWGQEDDAFCYAYEHVFKRKPARITCDLFTLYHEERDMTYSKRNLELVKNYTGVNKDVDIIMYLLNNRVNWG